MQIWLCQIKNQARYDAAAYLVDNIARGRTRSLGKPRGYAANC